MRKEVLGIHEALRRRMRNAWLGRRATSALAELLLMKAARTLCALHAYAKNSRGLVLPLLGYF